MRRSSAVVCLLAGVVFGLLSGQIGAQESATTKAIAVIDDFEDGDLDGWAGPTGPCTVENSSSTGANGSSRSLKITGDCGHYQGAWYNLGDWQPTGVTFWVRTDTTSFARAYVVLGDDSVASNNGAVFFSALNSGYWAVGIGTATFALEPIVVGQWYRVDLTLDWVGKTVDVSIDGVPRQFNVPFRSPETTSLTRLDFYNYQSAVSFLDQIQMSSPPASIEILRDGFESADTTGWSSTTPAAPQRLVIFDAGGTPNAIGGRSGADVLCGQAAQSMTGIPVSATTRALISVDASDQISNFPTRYRVPTDRPITGPNWEVIADDWADLLDGTIDQSLLSAGAQATDTYWYSGSVSNGSAVSTTCSGWTDDGTHFDGRYGDSQWTDSRWIDRGDATCGVAAYHVLCLAWR
jgi:hypothetical protein